jgi:hypothetical protein
MSLESGEMQIKSTMVWKCGSKCKALNFTRIITMKDDKKCWQGGKRGLFIICHTEYIIV